MKKETIIFMLLNTIQNIIAIGCFTALAGMFEKWWIILFTVFFWSRVSYSKEESTDKCKSE